jgi:hypothetical protein
MAGERLGVRAEGKTARTTVIIKAEKSIKTVILEKVFKTRL